MGWEAGGRLWLIHVDVWQKPTQYCKAITLQLKINNFLKNTLCFSNYLSLNIELTLFTTAESHQN